MRRRPASRKWLYVVGIVALIVVLSWVQFSIRSLGNDLERSRADNAALANQVKDLGATPVVAPPPVKGLSAEDVRSVVTDELSRHKVTLSQAEISRIARTAAALVPPPKDGVSPSPAQIRAVVVSAVTAYCAGDKCAGKKGDDGVTPPCLRTTQQCQGRDGEDAPKVTDEELLAAAKAALAAYCGQETKPCDGKDGTNGTNGADGRGIVSGPTCTGSGKDSYWVTTYTDGKEETQPGPCRIDVVPPITEPN